MKNKKKLPRSYIDRQPFDRHETDEFGDFPDRMTPDPALDSDPRMAEDAIDPEKPRGLWIKE